MFFYNSKVFGLRGLSEHKDFKAKQLTVSNDKIVFQEFVSKTIEGGLKDRKFSPKTIPQYSCPQNPRCVVDAATLHAYQIKAPFIDDLFLPKKKILLNFLLRLLVSTPLVSICNQCLMILG